MANSLAVAVERRPGECVNILPVALSSSRVLRGKLLGPWATPSAMLNAGLIVVIDLAGEERTYSVDVGRSQIDSFDPVA